MRKEFVMAEEKLHQFVKRVPQLYDKPENCCGCGACFSVCPSDAITMEPDKEGFLYPKINNEKCIRCYQCEKVCPIKYADRKGKNKNV